MKLPFQFTPFNFEDANLVHEEMFIPSGTKLACYSPAKAAEIANARLQKEFAKARIVYGKKDALVWTSQRETGDTHQAYVIGIQEIEKKECAHVPRFTSGLHVGLSCFNCNAKLKLPNVWEAE